MTQIISFNGFQLSTDDWVSNLPNNPGLSLLLVNGFHNLVLLHSISSLQENLFCSESKLLGLYGGTNQADVYWIDPASASQDFEITVPVWRDLKGVQSAEAMNSLSVPDQHPSSFKGKNSLIVPPLALNAILESKSLSPAVSHQYFRSLIVPAPLSRPAQSQS
jgi:hypothetical protein